MTLTHSDLNAIQELITQQFTKHLKPIKKDIKDIKTTQSLIIGQFDQRINHLEKHTTHPPKVTTFIPL